MSCLIRTHQPFCCIGPFADQRLSRSRCHDSECVRSHEGDSTNPNGPAGVLQLPQYSNSRLENLCQARILDKLDAQKQAEARRQFISQVPSRHAISITAYDDQEKRHCDLDTRIEMLADIKEWVYGISNDAQRFLWLTRDTGLGKLAITASITRKCRRQNSLGVVLH